MMLWTFFTNGKGVKTAEPIDHSEQFSQFYSVPTADQVYFIDFTCSWVSKYYLSACVFLSSLHSWAHCCAWSKHLVCLASHRAAAWLQQAAWGSDCGGVSPPSGFLPRQQGNRGTTLGSACSLVGSVVWPPGPRAGTWQQRWGVAVQANLSGTSLPTCPQEAPHKILGVPGSVKRLTQQNDGIPERT